MGTRGEWVIPAISPKDLDGELAAGVATPTLIVTKWAALHALVNVSFEVSASVRSIIWEEMRQESES